jgi:hypothetical protein
MWKVKILEKLHFRKLRTFVVSLFKFGIFNGQVGKVIIDFYDGYWGQQVDRGTGNLGFGLIHYSLISNLKPEKVLCVGSQKGYIPVICALACKDNKKGFVDFVDAGYDKGHPKAWSGIGFWKKINSKKHFSYMGVGNRINTYVMTTKDFIKKYPKQKYGYIYIDGDHSYKGVKNDFELFWPKLRKGGLICFHDIIAKGKFNNRYGFGVWKLWQRLVNKYPNIQFNSHPGLGILQKR